MMPGDHSQENPPERAQASHANDTSHAVPQVVAGTPAMGNTRHNWLGWTLALGAIAGCLLFLDVNDMMATVRRMKALEIVFVLVLLTCDRVLMALKWRLLLGIGGARLSVFSVIRIYYQGWLVGAALPSHLGGDLLRAHWIARRDGRGASSLRVDRYGEDDWARIGGELGDRRRCHRRLVTRTRLSGDLGLPRGARRARFQRPIPGFPARCRPQLRPPSARPLSPDPVHRHSA